jgi:hypothetical protein
VYAHIVSLFQNLKQFNIIGTFIMSYPALTLVGLPSTTFSSSTLTQLCIDVSDLDDCFYLLDGRLKQLTTLTVRVHYIADSLAVGHTMVGFNKEC